MSIQLNGTTGVTFPDGVTQTSGLATPISVANGGSGRTTNTAFAVVCGGTTTGGAEQSIASVGTTGQVLTSNGAGALPTFQAAAGGQVQFAVFASSGTWTCPAGVTRVKITCIGGGAGGNNNFVGSTGGGGGVGIGYFTVTPGTNYTVTIGNGGAGQTVDGSSGFAGTSSSVGSLITSTGGSASTIPSNAGAGGTCANSSFGTSTSVYDSSFGSFIYGAPSGSAAIIPLVAYGGIGPFYGRLSRIVTVSGQTAAVAWSLSNKMVPGAPGTAWNDGGDPSITYVCGGIGGAVAIEYVG